MFRLIVLLLVLALPASAYELCWDTGTVEDATTSAISTHPNYSLDNISEYDCSSQWRSDFCAYESAGDRYGTGSFAYINVTYSSAKRIGGVEYKLPDHQADTLAPQRIMLYANSTGTDEEGWQMVYQWYFNETPNCALLRMTVPYLYTVSYKYYKVRTFNANGNYTGCTFLDLYEIVDGTCD